MNHSIVNTHAQLVLLFLLSGSLVLAGCVSDSYLEAATEQLLQTDQAFAKYSVENSPAEAFGVYLMDDALQLPNGSKPITGRRSIVDSMREGPEYTLDWSPEHAEVAKSGELGWTWGTYVATFHDSTGAAIEATGKYLNIWKKTDDGWRVAVDMGNKG